MSAGTKNQTISYLSVYYVSHQHSALGHTRDANTYELNCQVGIMPGRVILDDVRKCDENEINSAMDLLNKVRNRDGLQQLMRGENLTTLRGQEGTYKLEKLN